MFYQPSTRTRFSFQSAALRLGAGTIGFDTVEGTRAGSSWGESLQDTARVICGYADCVVVRHAQVPGVQEFANHSTIPIINAGNGGGAGAEHPTQALLDVFTIREKFGTLCGLTIVLVGALCVRTVASFVRAMQHFPGSKLLLYQPGGQMPPAVQAATDLRGSSVQVVSSLDGVLEHADVLYHQGIVEDRTREIPAESVFDQRRLAALPAHAMILHSLPRAHELAVDVDQMTQAAYFEQAHNGLPIRMAVLEWALQSASLL
jgi:aspartate carbamoyltransferase catalytic subunit